MHSLTSRIDSVTVYRQGARITRVASLERGADGFPAVVSVPGLPLGLLDDSVRARIVTAPGHGLGAPRATDVRVSLSVVRSEEELPPADDAEIEAARVAVLEKEAVLKQVERELERLTHFDLRARVSDHKDGPAPKTPLAARLELLDLRSARWQALVVELAAAREELAARRRHRRTLEEQERRASTARQPRESELRKCAIISLSEGTAASVEVAIEYRVVGARWAPAYVARLEADGSAAEVGVRAVVAQRTGEDWTGVNLTLVTASADTTTELPELQSLRIGRRQKPPKTGWRPAPTGAGALFSDYDRVFGGAPAAEKETLSEFDDEIEDTRVRENRAPPPPPAPASAPQAATVAFGAAPGSGAFDEWSEQAGRMSVASAMAMDADDMDMDMPARAKSGGLGGLLTRSSTVRKKMAPHRGGGGPADFERGEAAPEPEPSAVRADDALLDYSGLRMSGAASSTRGALVRESLELRYREELIRTRWEASYNLVRVIAAAGQAAVAVAHKPVPDGYSADFDTEFDHSYFAESKIDVPSDGDFHSLALTSASGPYKLVYQVCPRESTDVFRIARLTNPLDAPLIDGPIDVYVGGDFLLSTQVSFTPPGGLVRFGLGVEQAIRVVRNTSFRDDSAGLLGGSRELHHQIRVEAQNHLERPIELEVRERVPVTREDEDDIRVELGSVSPRWEAFEPGDEEGDLPPLKGGFRWLSRLAAGEKTELKASYAIRISSKHELVGGNRRES